MPRKKLTCFAVALCALLALTSCNKWMSLKPPNGLIQEDFWKNKDQLNAAVLGIYASMLDNTTDGSLSLPKLLFLWGELRADMLAPTTGTSSDEIAIMDDNISPSNQVVNWSPVYQTINYCNNVIAFGPNVLKTDKTLSADTLNSYLAEARTIRALMYFYLVRSFGDVPLKLKPTATDRDVVSLAKSPGKVVLAQILKDLTEAEKDAVVTYGNQAEDKGRVTRYTVEAILADVDLWMEDYQGCVTACDKIINSRKFGLIPASSAWFNTVYRTGNSNESIFELEFNAQKLNPFFNMFAGNPEFLAANKVMDEVYTTDPLTGEGDIRGDGASVLANDNTIWKYVGANATDMISSNESYTHWFFYRYADVLLMKAEALAQLGDGAGALSLVRTLRERAHALAATDENPDPSDLNAVSLFVLDEAARETMFEGKRWYAVLRYAQRNNYANLDYLQNMAAGVVPPDLIKITKAKLKDPNSHYFPIPQVEIETNPNIIQNPFYQQ
jgi:hypothetical protein